MTLNNQSPRQNYVKVWDLLVRLFHWSLVVMVVSAYIFDSPRNLHEVFGYAVVGLIALRLVWGLIGTKHARFFSFIPGPKRFYRYLVDILHKREASYLGHNPAGAGMIVALLLTLAAVSVSGYMMGTDIYFGEEWVEDVHEGLVNFLIMLIVFHVVGVITASRRHRENLVKSMITGKKKVE